jgi:predicted AAA+ superfamily ATPase
MRNYLERLTDGPVEEAMRSAGCVLIEGPKWCGKSTTSRRFARTVVELQKPSNFKQYKLFADVGDDNLLKGEKPLMFDEWQKIPDLWDYIRADIDETGERGQYILTGSAKPVEDGGRHSGTGRIKRLVMRPMSLWESGESVGEVSLKDLFDGDAKISGKENRGLAETAYTLCRGGWPQAVVEDNKKTALKAAKDYVASLVATDITDVDGIKRNPSRARAVLKAYARNISTAARLTTIQNDVASNDAALDTRTLDSYINAFKKLFVIEDVEAWSPRLRSKAVLRTTNTRQFVDPSIAAAALGASPDDLMSDLNTFGLLFETMCLRDLRIYAECIDGAVYNYRDSQGLEADAIVHLNDGKWCAVEIKLGGDENIESGAKHLLAVRDKIDTQKMRDPSFLMVMTATQYAYKRKDGVFVVPIGCLKN